jgi:hypothetical protein
LVRFLGLGIFLPGVCPVPESIDRIRAVMLAAISVGQQLRSRYLTLVFSAP